MTLKDFILTALFGIAVSAAMPISMYVFLNFALA